MKEFLGSLRTTAWRTAGARYNAARRLRRREWFSTFSLASLSALSIAVAFAQKIYSPQSGTPLDNYLTAMSASLGVFLLAISLLEWGAAYGAKAEALHRNAEGLTAFQLKLAQTLAFVDGGRILADDQVDQLRLEYQTIKDECLYNHSPGDHRFFHAQQRTAPEFADANKLPLMSVRQAWVTGLVWHASAVWFFALIWLIVASALVLSWWIPKS